MAEATQTQEAVVEKKGGSNVMLIVIVALLFILVIGGAVAAYFMLNSDKDVIDDANSVSTSKSLSSHPTKTSTTQRATDYSKIGPMYPMDQYIVNLYNEGSSRYLKTTINFELSSQEMSAEMDAKKPLIRDIVIKTLSAKTYEEISTIKGKENLKDEIVSKVNQVLTDGQVNNIFFTDFVIQ